MQIVHVGDISTAAAAVMEQCHTTPARRILCFPFDGNSSGIVFEFHFREADGLNHLQAGQVGCLS